MVSHTIALKSDGTLWAWGDNFYGQLGDGTNIDKYSPVQIGIDNKWVSIAAVGCHTIALKSDGTLWVWGWNYYGQLGDGTNIVDRNSPVQIGTDNKWVSIAAGNCHTIAIKSDGTLWAWGSNYNGQLGDGTNIDKNTPVQIGTDNKWVSIAAGKYHSIALKSDSTLWVWGKNSLGQLGDGKCTYSGMGTPIIGGITCGICICQSPSLSFGYVGSEDSAHFIKDTAYDVFREDITDPNVCDATVYGAVRITLKASASDNDKLESVYFTLRKKSDTQDIPIGYEDEAIEFDEVSGQWEYSLDTTLLDDGYYILTLKAIDLSGNTTSSDPINFSIRNWEIVERPPASKTFQPGDTIPINFALRIAPEVDPIQPFVYNEDLMIKVLDADGNPLQESTFGDTRVDYSIDQEAELYITNFKTSEDPMEYQVEIYRIQNEFLIGKFNIVIVD